jgi:hypothetical protein
VNGEHQTQVPHDGLESSVERLTRVVVEYINAGPEEGREVLREISVAVLRDEVQIIDSGSATRAPRVGAFNFFGIGIPLLFTGCVLFFLFPPIGLLFFAIAVVTVLCGVGVTLWSRKKTT